MNYDTFVDALVRTFHTFGGAAVSFSLVEHRYVRYEEGDDDSLRCNLRFMTVTSIVYDLGNKTSTAICVCLIAKVNL